MKDNDSVLAFGIQFAIRVRGKTIDRENEIVFRQFRHSILQAVVAK